MLELDQLLDLILLPHCGKGEDQRPGIGDFKKFEGWSLGGYVRDAFTRGKGEGAKGGSGRLCERERESAGSSGEEYG